MLITYRGAVYPWHCDHMGHMNVMWYVGKFDEATWHLFAPVGITRAYMRDSGRAMGAVQQNISYMRELMSGDIVEVRSRFLEVRTKALRFEHEMINAGDGSVCSRCEQTAVHIDTSHRRAAPFPEAIRAAIEQSIGKAAAG
jgi:acyl-CoA thioester hydrolase